MTCGTGKPPQGEGGVGKRLPVQKLRVRALPSPPANRTRTILLEADAGTATIGMVLTAGQAATLMFEIGFALEEAARASDGLSRKRSA